MYLTDDGLYPIILEEDYTSSPIHGDIHIEVTGELGEAKIILLYFNTDKEELVPITNSYLTPENTYRLSNRDPDDIFCLVSNAGIYTSVKLDIRRKEIDASKGFIKAVKVYDPKEVLVSYLYPIYQTEDDLSQSYEAGEITGLAAQIEDTAQSFALESIVLDQVLITHDQVQPEETQQGFAIESIVLGQVVITHDQIQPEETEQSFTLESIDLTVARIEHNQNEQTQQSFAITEITLNG